MRNIWLINIANGPVWPEELSQVYQHLQPSALNVDDTNSNSIYMANDER